MFGFQQLRRRWANRRRRLRHSAASQPSHARRLFFEQFERRILLANVSGHITSDTLWNDTSAPYKLIADLTIDAGATLTLGPGVVLRTDNYTYDIAVDGRLVGTNATIELRQKSGSNPAELNVKSTGELSLTGGTIRGPGELRARNGSTVDLSGVNFAHYNLGNGDTSRVGSPTVTYFSGSSGTLDNTSGSWDLFVESGSAVSVVNGIDVTSLKLSEPITVNNGTIDVLTTNSSATVTNSRIGYVNLTLGAPTLTGNTFTSTLPIRLTNPDRLNVDNVNGNTFTATFPWVYVRGNLDSDERFRVIDGKVRGYLLSGDLLVVSGATLTLEPSVLVRSDNYTYDILVEGRLEGTNATIELRQKVTTNPAELNVKSTGELSLTGGTIRGPGELRAQNGSTVDLSGVNFAHYDVGNGDGSRVGSPTAVYFNGSSGTLGNITGSWDLTINSRAISADFATPSGSTTRFTNAIVKNAPGRTIASDGGEVRIQNTVLTGGSLKVTNKTTSRINFVGNITLNDVDWVDLGAGAIRVANGATAQLFGDNAHRFDDSTILVIPGDSQLNLAAGEFHNDGDFRLWGDNGNTARLNLLGDVTLSGNGQVTMNVPDLSRIQSATGATLTVGADQAVRGTGRVEVGVINHGVLSANRAGQSLALRQAATNFGELQAVFGGTLTVEATPAQLWRNEGRIQSFDSNATINLLGGELVNTGTIISTGGLINLSTNRFHPGEGSVEATGGTVAVQPKDSSDFLISGATDPSGTIWEADLVGGNWKVGPSSTLRLFEPASRVTAASTVIGESGTVTTSQPGPNVWHTVTFSHAYADPVVVMGPVSFNGADPLIARVRNVTTTSFEFQFDEWDYLNGFHDTETVGWLAIESGSHALDDGRQVVAGITTANEKFKSVSLTGLTGTPVVLAQVVSYVQTPALTTRLQNVTSSGFQVRVQEEQANNPAHAVEQIAYVALETGSGATAARLYEVGRTPQSVTDKFSSIPFQQPFTSAPVFIASIQTFAGSDPVSLRSQSLSANSVQVVAHEEQSTDTEIGHGPEVVGYLALASTRNVRIRSLAANVELSGGQSNFFGSDSGSFDALSGLTTVAGTGELTVRDGRNYSSSGSLTNNGVVHVENGSQFSIPTGQVYTQADGTTTINGSIHAPGGVSVTGGVLDGSGTVNANVTNAGLVAPGNSPEILEITGNYVQASDGTLLIEIAGRDANIPEFDRLRVTGTATLDGTVRVELLDDFEPGPGDEFRVLTTALRIGKFATHDLPAPGGSGRRLSPLYDAFGMTFQVQVVPPLDFIAATTGGVNDGELHPRQVVKDLFGNNYVTGSFQGTVDFDREHAGGTLTSTGTDGYVAKYDSAGQLLWVKKIDGTSGASGSGIAIDHHAVGSAADDAIFLTGSFSGSLSYDGGATALTASGSEETFLARIGSSGTAASLVGLTSDSNVSGRRLAVAPNGNVFVAGEFLGTADVDPSGSAFNLISESGSNDAFVLELSSSFGFVRAARLGGSGSDQATDVAVSSSGEVWLAGSFAATTNGLATLTAAGIPADLRSDAFLLKLAPSGTSFTSSVARSYGAAGNDTATALVVDPSGNAILGGNFGFSVDFDVDPAKAFTLHSTGDRDLYVVKLAAGGEFRWARAVGGYRDDLLFDLAVDDQGNVYTTGEFRDRVDFNPLDGSHILATSSETVQEAFLSKLDDDGRFVWAAQLGDQSGAVSSGRGLDVDNTGRVASVGQFRGTVDFDPTDATQSRTFTPAAGGTFAGYLSLLDQKEIPTVTLAGLPAGAIQEGTTLALAATVVDSDSFRFDYAWSVTLDGEDYAAGTKSTLSTFLAAEGLYTVDLLVTDESGNRDSTTATLVVNNAAPALQPMSFGMATQLIQQTPASGNSFGSALATGNGFILVGTPQLGGTATGQAILYDPAASPPNNVVMSFSGSAAGDRFGTSVTILGPRVIVGAPGVGGTGAVFVYEYNPSLGAPHPTTNPFVLTHILTGPTPVSGDRFGAALRPLGGMLLIGSPGRTVDSIAGVGAAYLYDPSSGKLLQTYRNPTAEANDEFGAALAVAGDKVLVGAPGDDKAGLDRGTVHLIDPDTLQTILEIVNPTPDSVGEKFGAVLAAQGFHALIGAPLDNTAGTNAGGVYMVDLNPDSASYGQLIRTLRSPNPGAGKLGSAIAISGTRALVGAESDGQDIANSGTAFVFDIDPSSATFGASLPPLKSTAPVGGDRFGASVAFLGSEPIVGATDRDAVASDAGAVYRFAPKALLSFSSSSIAENGQVTVSGAFADPGVGDTHTVVIDWDDQGALTRIRSAAGVGTFSATYQYLDDNPSNTPADLANIRVRVQDNTLSVLAAKPAAHRLNVYDSTTLDDQGPLVAAGSGGLSTPSALAVGPGGDIYVSGGAAGSNPVLRFDGVTGERVGNFIPAGSQGTTKAADLVFGPDDNLYYLDAAGSRVLRFDGVTGASLGVFVSAGSGGLSDPRAAAFGPDGNLYVASFGSDSILGYDGQTGASIGTLVSSADGLNDPQDLAFGRDNQLFVFTAVPTAAVLRFDAVTGEAEGTLARPTLSGATGFLLALNDKVYVGDPGGPLLAFDAETGLPSGTANTADGALVGYPPQAQATSSVTVSNAAPTVIVEAIANNTVGRYSLRAIVEDAGSLDTIGYVWSVSGTATAIGASNLQDFTFSAAAGTYTVSLTVTDDDTGSASWGVKVQIGTPGADTITVTNPAAGINQIVVYALAGNDRVNASAVTTVPVELIGGGGNDTLDGGTQDDLLLGNSPGDYALGAAGDTGNDSLKGNAGDDTLDGGLGNDKLLGGRGNDEYLEVPGSSDVLIEGGSGFGLDTINFGLATFGITFSLFPTTVQQIVNPSAAAANQHTVEIQGDFENLRGSQFNDKLTGNGFDNNVNGGLGDDTIFGGDELNLSGAGDGNNTLEGGPGSDTIIGGSGNDIIFGGDEIATPGDGNDKLEGGTGNDTVVGGAGNDIIFGGDEIATPGDGNDQLKGGAGNDSVVGGAGNDIIFGGDEIATPGDGNDTLRGGAGNDTVVGGAGNDIIFGGDEIATPGDGNDRLEGGAGDDTVVGGAGNDIIFGGDEIATPGDGNDRLEGGAGDDTVVGGAGNDIIFGGDEIATPGDGDDDLSGGAGSDTVIGGAGNDIIFGGDELATPGDGADTLDGGPGNDTLVGGAGNDIIFGRSDNDELTGDSGNDLFEGGSGVDRIVETRDADMTLSPTTLVISGTPAERHFDIEQATLIGGPGNNRLDAATFPGAVVLRGLGGNDVLIGGAQADQLFGGSGDDSLVGNAGDDLLDGGPGNDTMDGGLGNDTYLQTPGSDDVLNDAQGIDFVDFSGASFAIDVDLSLSGNQQIDQMGNQLILNGTFENTRGTSFNDVLKGNAARNIIDGGGGRDSVDGGANADTIQGSFPQLVYLDFDSATGPREKVYSTEERNEIQARLERIYGVPFSIAFTQTEPPVGRFTRIVVNAGDSSANEVLVAGRAFELDWRNSNAASRAEVNVNGFLGRRGRPEGSSTNFVSLTTNIIAHELGHLFGLRHSDSFGPLGINPATNLPYGVFEQLITRTVSRNEKITGSASGSTLTYQLKRRSVLLQSVGQAGNAAARPHQLPTGTIFDSETPVASFTVDPLGNVQFTALDPKAANLTSGSLDGSSGRLDVVWSAPPTASSIVITYHFDAFRPGYRGPDDATETPRRIMPSPASVGTALSDALAKATHFSEREAIKLAFADASTSVQEANLSSTAAPTALGGSAHDLGTLPPLAVPNLLPPGAINYGSDLRVRAINVVGSIERTAGGSGPSENDVYAFQGKAGEIVTLEVLSVSIRQRLLASIDSMIGIYDSAGNVLDFHGKPAFNDDGFESQDALLIDVRLPANGTYYAIVDTFKSQSVPDTDTGGYELFIYSYDPAPGPRLGGGGDTLIGGSGPDVLIGSAGDDLFIGDAAEDLFLGVSSFDQVGPANEAPSITSASAVDAAENQTSVLDVQSTDPDGETEGGGGLTYSLTGGADQAKFSIDSNSGVLTFKTAPDFENPADAGGDNGYEVQVTVTDAGPLTGVQDITVTVTNVNEAPSITSSAAVNAVKNQTSAIDVQSTDPDGETEGGGGLTYSLTGGADQTKFSIDSNTGVLTFKTAPDFNNPTDAGGDNVYDVQVTVTDAGSLTGVQDIAVTVVNSNDAPSITSASAANVVENQTSVLDVQSTDPDGETEGGGGLVYSLTGGADQALFLIDSNSGVLTFKAAPNFEDPADAGGNNGYEVQVTVTDAGSLAGLQNVAVTVTNVNESPSLTSPATANAAENQTSVVDVQSTDPEGETEAGGGLTYSLTGGADLALFSIDSNSGVLTFKSAPNFENAADAGGNNVYDVQVTVTDSGSLTGLQDIAVSVTNVNESPSISSAAAVNAAENQTSVIDVQATDLDGETEAGGGLTYSLSGGADRALFTIHGNSGVLTFKAPPDFENPADADGNNVYVVQVTVTDGGSLTGLQDIAVTVTDVYEVVGATGSVAFNVVSSTVTEASLVHTIGVRLNLTAELFLGADVEVRVRDAGTGTATGGGVDYSHIPRTTVLFPAGSVSGTTKSFQIQFLLATQDQLVEGNETIDVKIQSVTPTGSDNITAGTSTHQVTIIDDDPASLSIQASDTVTEEGGLQTTNVTLSISTVGFPAPVALAVPVTAQVVDAGGGATSGMDYTPFGTQIVTFPVGATTGMTRTVTLTPLNDLLVEGNETVNLTLQNPAGPATLAATASTVTLDDDDAATLSIQATDSATEQGSSQTTNVTLTLGGSGTGPALLAVPLAANVVDAGGGSATGGTDYAAFGTQSVSFPAGATHGTTDTVELTPLNDALVEGHETVNLGLQNLSSTLAGQATLGTTASTVTIIDDDAASATLSIQSTDPATEQGGTQTTEVTLTLSAGGSLSVPITVDVVDAGGGSATGGTDYTPIGTQTLTFGVGATSGTKRTVWLTPLNDLLVEGDESVILTLQNPSGPAVLGTTTSMVTIADDDTATLSITATDTASEQGGTQTTGVALTLGGSGTGTSSLAVPISADVVDVGSGSAARGVDYMAIGKRTMAAPGRRSDRTLTPVQTVIFAVGATTGTTQTVSLTPMNDLLLEGNETVKLVLQNPSGPARLGTTSSTITILDDETATLSIQAGTVTEHGGAQTTAVALTLGGSGSGTAALAATVTADVVDASGGSATSGTDYAAFGIQTVTFAVGSTAGTTQSVSLTPANDSLVEGNETVNLALQNLNGPTPLGTTAGTVTIVDDETATLSMQASDTASEQGGAKTTDVTLTMSGSGTGTPALAVPITVDVVDTGAGTAIGGTDYAVFGSRTVSGRGSQKSLLPPVPGGTSAVSVGGTLRTK